MMLKVPKSVLGVGNLDEFWFKFADNSVKDGDAMQFWDQGDAAPAGKLCYQYLKK